MLPVEALNQTVSACCAQLGRTSAVDLARAEEVRYLPKWVWAIFCMGIGLTIPFGGIAYLVFGKVRRPRPR